MEYVIIGILFMIGIYIAPFILTLIIAFFVFLGVGIIEIVKRFKQ